MAQDAPLRNLGLISDSKHPKKKNAFVLNIIMIITLNTFGLVLHTKLSYGFTILNIAQ